MPTPELTVRQVMQTEPVTMAPTDTVQAALKVMNERRIGSVLIVDGDLKLVGIFTERDLLKRVVSAIPGWRDYLISEWMTPNPHIISPDVGWNDAVNEMQRKKVRHLPVIENDKVIGILSPRGLMARRTAYLNMVVDERTYALRETNELLLARDAEMTQTLRAAGRLQKQLLLPREVPTCPWLDWAIYYKPLDYLGGDYYDYAEPTPGLLGVLVADAAGHSVAAAMVAVMARIAFGENAHVTPQPGAVLAHMNEKLIGLADERFVSAAYAVLDTRTRVLKYAGAGHPYPLHYVAATGEVKSLVSSGFLLGIVPGEIYREREVTLAAGDAIVFYTDGVVEARNEIGEMFGTDRLTECVKSNGKQNSKELLNAILLNQKNFCGTQAWSDDVTMLILSVS